MSGEARYDLSAIPEPGAEDDWSGAQPEVFEDVNFEGPSQLLVPGIYELADSAGVGDDKISSVRVPPGWQVTLYADAGLQGPYVSFTEDAAHVGDVMNDQASSIEVEYLG